MTEQEAQRLLDEHRQPPRFVRGRRRFVVGRDGRVAIYRLTQTRARYELTVDAEWCTLPTEVQRAAREYQL